MVSPWSVFCHVLWNNLWLRDIFGNVIIEMTLIQYELFLGVEGVTYDWSFFHNDCIYEDFPHYVLPCVLKDTLQWQIIYHTNFIYKAFLQCFKSLSTDVALNVNKTSWV